MKTNRILLSVASLLIAMAGVASAKIIAGPIVNPANGHEYYLLAPGTWKAAESEAEYLGGTLAVIRNAAEQEWVFSKFGNHGGTNNSLWIGRQRAWRGGPFICTAGEQVDFYNWNPGEPNNSGGDESFVQMYENGRWNDNIDTANPVCGVVEVPGKAEEKSLTSTEKSLIGNWYESGNGERPAWIAGTENQIFLITHDRHAARLIITPDGFIYDGDRQHGEIVKDKIVWSNGTWWSRKPSAYDWGKISPGTSPDDGKSQLPSAALTD